MTLDIDSLRRAFLRVKANRGCAGVDGVTIDGFERRLEGNLNALAKDIESRIYRPLPLLKMLVDKGKGEARALSIPAVSDRVAQSAVLETVGPLFEAEFEDCSFGYRKGRSVRQAVARIKKYYDNGYRWVIDADIDAFFDTVDHDLLMGKVKRLLKDKDVIGLMELWVKGEVWDGKIVGVPSKGIPQGSAVSPMLANLFLDELDEELMANGYKLVRYADDFVVLCKDRKEAEGALELTDAILDRLSLALDESDIVSFDHGFRFLGVIFLKSMALAPFDKPKEKRKILYYPPPLNLPEYLLKRER